MSKKAKRAVPEVSFKKGELLSNIAASLLTVVFIFSIIIITVRQFVDNEGSFHEFLVRNSFALNSSIIATVCAIVIASLRSRRVDRLHDEILRNALIRVVDGEYEAKEDTEDFICTEVNNISREYAALTAEKDKLIADNAALEKECSKAVQRSLSARVNPAMLKRAFEGITKMAAEGRTEDITAISDDLAEVIAASAEDGSNVVSLADELSRIKRFLEIMEILDQKKYNCRMSIMCNIVNYRVLPNLILPIAQTMFDAAKHPEEDKYEMCVEATSSPSSMLVILRDNSANQIVDEGCGEIVTSLTTLEENSRELSIALLNHRISAYYGEKFGIKVSSTMLGNTIYIYLPPHISD